MNIADRYFIKTGYQENPVQNTYDIPDAPKYWSEVRIQGSHVFQYHVYELARELILKNAFHSVMDVGSGPGTKVQELIAPICSDVALVDQPSTKEIVEARFPEARFVAADLSKIDLNLGRKFDLIICADVLEHLLDPNHCLEFIGKHVASHGLVVLSTPERDNLRGKNCTHSPHPSHVREWSSNEFCDYLEHEGWRIHQFNLYPQMRLNPVEQAAWKVLGPGFFRRRWGSCQAVVCTPIAFGRP